MDLDGAVYACPIVDEVGTQGIAVFDLATQAYYAWIPGRPTSTFLGNPEFDATCDCEVWDRGWYRVQRYLDPEGLARLTRGEPYSVR